jgi:hypothetical protein
LSFAFWIRYEYCAAVILAQARIQRRNLFLDSSESWNDVVSSLANSRNLPDVTWPIPLGFGAWDLEFT